MGPHPAVAEVRRAVRGTLSELSGPVLVACSGGADSLALASAVAFEAPRAGLRAGLVTVDHGLQDGSGRVAAAVATLGHQFGLDPVEVVAIRVGSTGGPEAAARRARYGALAALADALQASVLLGHTLDDQAETVLLGLGRGSGPRSIAGMRPRDGRYLRPFLTVRRHTTRAACDALGLQPWQDAHNTDPAYQRARLRGDVLPLLEEVLQGGVAEALARTADLIRDDVDALDAIAEAHLPHAAQQDLVITALAVLPRAIRTRVLRRWAHTRGVGPLTAAHLSALDALVVDWHGQGPVDLPGGRRVSRISGRLVDDRSVPDPPEQPRE